MCILRWRKTENYSIPLATMSAPAICHAICEDEENADDDIEEAAEDSAFLAQDLADILDRNPSAIALVTPVKLLPSLLDLDCTAMMGR